MIYHQADGTGEPLLLLNGIAMTGASWQPVAAPLAEHFTVIRCDLRGQLMSPGSPPADVGDHVGDVVELLDDLGVDSVHVLATSFGGAVGALLAARHPDRVRSLLTIASADGFTDVMAVEVARWREAYQNDMAARIQEAQGERVERERLAHEVDLAREIQALARVLDGPPLVPTP